MDSIGGFLPAMPWGPAADGPAMDGNAAPELLGANDWQELSEAVIEDYLTESGLDMAHLLGLYRHLPGEDGAETSALRELLQRLRRWRRVTGVDGGPSADPVLDMALMGLPGPLGRLVAAGVA